MGNKWVMFPSEFPSFSSIMRRVGEGGRGRGVGRWWIALSPRKLIMMATCFRCLRREGDALYAELCRVLLNVNSV